MSHVDPIFIEQFGSVLDQLPQVFEVEGSELSASVAEEERAQAVVLAGSGTLGWDLVAANLVEAGHRVLVINGGYFGDSFGDCLHTYGAQVSHLKGLTVGQPATPEQLRQLLEEQEEPFALVTITQVDTSTGVLSPVAEYTQVVRRSSSAAAVVVVDGVCSVGGESLPMSAWDVDVAFTASQKALGVPPGLLVAMLRARALRALAQRRTPVASYYASLRHWLPVFKAYQGRRASYFATPPVQLIQALHTALRTRLLPAGGVRARVAEHRRAATAFRAALAALGLQLLVPAPAQPAHTLSAVRFPAGVDGPKLLAALRAAGVVLAGGLHKELRALYFRVGHMGVSVAAPLHLLTTLQALEDALAQQAFALTPGAAKSAFLASWESFSQ